MATCDDFFAPLPPLTEFSDVTHNENFTPLPQDWLIVLSDVKGSTQAIKDGAYKNVNMIGAACIMGILNKTKGYHIPYVFGGDGATLAIPPFLRADVEEILIQIRQLAMDNFSL